MNTTHTQTLLDMLALCPDTANKNTFVGQSYNFVGSRIFGGQVLAQALMASSQTTDKPCHSLHAYFLVGGDIRYPVSYEVITLRDGRSLSSRQIIASQLIDNKKQVIFIMLASHAPMSDELYAKSLNYHTPMPAYPSPDRLKDEHTLKAENLATIPAELHESYLHQKPILIKPINPKHPITPSPALPRQAVWLTVPELNNENIAIHQALLAFSSDFYLIATSLMWHGLSYRSPNMQMASIDHSLHFHRPFDVSKWLLHEMRSDVTGYDRGLNLGQFWQNGELVASSSQEGLIRQKSN